MALPRNVIDMTGKHYGRYTVLEYAGQNKDHKAVWKCRCDCGVIKNVTGKDLRSGNTKSCGCYNFEKRSENPALWKPVHGLSNHPLMQVWADVKQRCYNEKSKAYKWYGERGVKLCEDWMAFKNFYDWAIKNGYKSGLTLDRIDPNGDYSPDNCRWVNMKIQQNNRRNNKLLNINGVTKTMSEWADEYGADYILVKSRISAGWEPERALSQRKNDAATITIGEETKTFKEWSEISGVNRSTIEDRIKHGWDAKKAVFAPPNSRYRRKL